MNKLEDYIFKEKIYKNSNSVIYKAISNEGETPVIIKMHSKENPTLKDEVRFQLQYEIANDFDNDGIIKMHDLRKFNNTQIIIMEYFEGSSPIPRIISDIIMKLIQKNVEDRYQSSFGINYD